MVSNISSNAIHLPDMPFKKRLVVFVIAAVLFLTIVSYRKRDRESDLDIKMTIGKFEFLLRDLRGQVMDRLNMCKRNCVMWDPDLPVIYVITPTYARPVQKAELTRLSHTLMHVVNIHWVVVEDAQTTSAMVEGLLLKTGLNHTLLAAPTPPSYRRKASEPSYKRPRGVEQRNTALRWLRSHTNLEDKAVVYFADDDNTYTLQVFEEMRWTKGVSVWPVGLVGGLMVERPVLDKTGKVNGFNSAWRPDRPFPIDMAGFAINLSLLLHKSTAEFSFEVPGGFQESALLSQLTTRAQLEPVADNCTTVLVWHTRTETPKLSEEFWLRKKSSPSDTGIEV